MADINGFHCGEFSPQFLWSDMGRYLYLVTLGPPNIANPTLNPHWASASSADSTSVPWLTLKSHGRFPSFDPYPTKTTPVRVGILSVFSSFPRVNRYTYKKAQKSRDKQQETTFSRVFFSWSLICKKEMKIKTTRHILTKRCHPRISLTISGKAVSWS